MTRPQVRVDGVCLRFEGLQVLRDVAFSCSAGEVLGLVGPNGAGKTSLLNCLSGVYVPQSGSMEILGRQVRGRRPDRIAALGVARTFQGLEAFAEFTVLDLVLLGRHLMLAPHGILSYGLGLPFIGTLESRHRREAMEVLDTLGIADYAALPLAAVPYGVAKMADLARAVATEAPVLLLDEPASGLDVEDRRELAATLERVISSRTSSVIMVEHDMTLVSRTCSRVLVLSSGETVFDGPTAESLADPLVSSTLLGR